MKAISSPNHLYPGLYDSHCHLYHLRQQGLDILHALRQWHSEGLKSLLNIVLEPDEQDWQWHLEIVRHCRSAPQTYPQILLATGIHPNDTSHKTASKHNTADPEQEILQTQLERMARRAAGTEVQAIGETGLDYSRSTQDQGLQKTSLRYHIHLAQHLHKVLVVHNRDSDSDILQILCKEILPKGGIMHCFSGNPQLITGLLDQGFYFSFAGNLTYKNAENLRHAAAAIPPERLLLETDAPFLAPQAVRGQINHPGFIGHTLEVLALCQKLDLPEMLRQLQQNWLRLFPCLKS